MSHRFSPFSVTFLVFLWYYPSLGGKKWEENEKCAFIFRNILSYFSEKT